MSGGLKSSVALGLCCQSQLPKFQGQGTSPPANQLNKITMFTKSSLGPFVCGRVLVPETVLEYLARRTDRDGIHKDDIVRLPDQTKRRRHTGNRELGQQKPLSHYLLEFGNLANVQAKDFLLARLLDSRLQLQDQHRALVPLRMRYCKG